MKRQCTGLTSLVPVYSLARFPSIAYSGNIRPLSTYPPRTSSPSSSPILSIDRDHSSRFLRARKSSSASGATSRTEGPGGGGARSRNATTLSSYSSGRREGEVDGLPHSPATVRGPDERWPSSISLPPSSSTFTTSPTSALVRHRSSTTEDEIDPDREAFHRLGLTHVPGRGIPVFAEGMLHGVFDGDGWAGWPGGRLRDRPRDRDWGVQDPAASSDSSRHRARRSRGEPVDTKGGQEEISKRLGITHVRGRGIPFFPIHSDASSSSSSATPTSPLIEYGQTSWPFDTAQSRDIAGSNPEANNLEFDLEKVGGYWVKPPLVARALRELEMEMGSSEGSWAQSGKRLVGSADEIRLAEGEENETQEGLVIVESIPAELVRFGVSQSNDKDFDAPAVTSSDPSLANLKENLKLAGYGRSGSRSEGRQRREDKQAQRTLREHIATLRAGAQWVDALATMPLGTFNNLLRSAMAYSRPEQGLELIRDVSRMEQSRLELNVAALREVEKWYGEHGPPGAEKQANDPLACEAYQERGPAQDLIVEQVVDMSVSLASTATSLLGQLERNFPSSVARAIYSHLLRAYIWRSETPAKEGLLRAVQPSDVCQALEGHVRTYSEPTVTASQAGAVEARHLAIRTLAMLLERGELLPSMRVQAVMIQAGWLPELPDRTALERPSRLVFTFVDLIAASSARSDYSIAVQIASVGQRVVDSLGADAPTSLWRDATKQLAGSLVAARDPIGLSRVCRLLASSTTFRATMLPPGSPQSLPLLQAIYAANGRSRMESSLRLYFVLRKQGYPPPADKLLLDMPQTIDRFSTTARQDLRRLIRSVQAHPSCLTPAYVPVFVSSLARSKNPSAAKDMYLGLLTHGGGSHGPDAFVDLKRDPDVMLSLVTAFGKDRLVSYRTMLRRPRDRAFAKQVIRNFVIASPPVDDLTPDALTTLERAFVIVEAPKSAFQILEHVAASHRGPTRRDLVVLLRSVIKKDPEAGLELVKTAMEKRAIPESVDRRAILAAFPRGKAVVYARAEGLLK